MIPFCSVGYTVLTDFGIAKMPIPLNKCHNSSGTHGYMVTVLLFDVTHHIMLTSPTQAPEVYVGKHTHGPAADWYAVGVTGFELFTGRR